VVEVVVFDWDGTLLDAREATVAAFRATTAAVLGTPFPFTEQDAAMLLQMRVADACAMLVEDQSLTAVLVERFNVEYDRLRPLLVRPVAGAPEALRHLKDDLHVRALVATAKTRHAVMTEAHEFGLLDWIDSFVTGDDTITQPPDPSPLLLAARTAGVAPHDCLWVADAPHDVIAGRSAGMVTVAAAYGDFGRAELCDEGPDFVIDHLSELASVVARHDRSETTRLRALGKSATS
jgi:phosphoglycolate phosphatase-like HAD superfamily hydrolase